jgi:DNA-binding transcriptional regulator YdaS (Cro superfamily)
MSVQKLIDAAIAIAGSQARLGRACGVSQNAIYAARLKGRCSPGLAIKIEAATGIARSRLCPEIFGYENAQGSGKVFVTTEARP